MAKTIAIIPARSHKSNSIKDDNLLSFIGRPIITYAIEEAKKSKLFDTIYVSTDSIDISKVSASMGVNSNFLRPKELSGESIHILPVIEWTLKKFAELGDEFDDVFVIFPRFPLLCAKDMKDAYNLYVKNGRKFGLMTVSEAPSKIEKYFRIKDDVLIAIDESHSVCLNKNLEPAFYNAGAFSIFPSSAFSGKDIKNIAFQVPSWKSIEINTNEDLDFSEILYKALHG